MLRQTLLYLSQSAVARGFVRHAPFADRLAHRFVVGETIPEAIAGARTLNEAGMSVSLDYLGESVSNRDEARAAADVYIELLDRIAAEALDANCSLKLTQMGQDIDDDFLLENVRRVLDRAAAHDIFIRFDMESSDYVDRTLDLFTRLWEMGYRNIGVVLQSYLYRSEADARRISALGARIRLCKGAYDEPASVAYPAKADVDANFVRIMKLLLTEGVYPGIATHDPAMIRATRDFAREQGIDASRYEFQMLYGVARALQKQIVRDGYRLRIYVGYGEAWYPYFMRRLAERPANVLFVVANVLRDSPFGALARRRNGRGAGA
jgi:proline dehydrogenase